MGNSLQRGFKFFHVLIVALTMVSIYCSTIFQTNPSITITISLHILITFLIWSYIQVVRLDPGKPIILANEWQMLRKKYCQICNTSKPERCHVQNINFLIIIKHCNSCQRCVLMMDHHCPWVNNCIGYENRKQFILLLLYAGLVSIICAFQLTITSKETLLTQQLCIPLYLNTLYNDSIAIALVFFIRYHLHLVSQNLTTLEDFINKQCGNSDNQYNRGALLNFKQIFGDNYLYWPLPLKSNYQNSIDGIEWPKPEQPVLTQTPTIMSPPTIILPLQVNKEKLFVQRQ